MSCLCALLTEPLRVHKPDKNYEIQENTLTFLGLFFYTKNNSQSLTTLLFSSIIAGFTITMVMYSENDKYQFTIVWYHASLDAGQWKDIQ